MLDFSTGFWNGYVQDTLGNKSVIQKYSESKRHRKKGEGRRKKPSQREGRRKTPEGKGEEHCMENTQLSGSMF